MRTPFTKIVERFEILSSLSNVESDYSAEIILGKDNLGLELFSPQASELSAEPSPCHEALEAFLRALPSEHVVALCSLMYAGRDGAEEPTAYDNGPTEVDQAIESILEKSPRAEYVRKAIAKLTSKAAVDDLPARYSAQ